MVVFTSFRPIVVLALSLTSIFFLSCSTRNNLNSEALSGKQARSKRSPEAIIASIKALAKSATERAQKDGGVSIPASRLKFAEFISDLKEASPKKPFEETLRLKVGSWQEIWSDEQNPTPPNQKILKPQVYQVIREDGVGFNFGVRSIAIPNGPTVLGTAGIQLKTEALPESEEVKVTFIKTFSKKGDLSQEASFTELAQGLLDGSRINAEDFKIEEERKFPRGPVGAVGFLKTVYIDDNFRIDQGPNPFSKVVDTFILVRTDRPQ